MNFIIASTAGLFAGAAGALGLGGGGVLMIYLTLFAQTGQLEAQGINLLFFLPTAAVAVCLHAKEGLIKWKTVWPAILLGVIGAGAGFWVSGVLGGSFLRTAFALLLIFLGLRELLSGS
ncbi:MAG: sulfite exporter TauE/SafE family protein [Oscillospiraceae bacterium]|jgi:uncharacterized membrane protein YfcA|nr:sulfite exporter TauE/SafE family protein [Oscillospiraceae bacterium]